MTQPRHTADTITDDALDQLYERLRTAEQDADSSVAAAAQLTALVGKRSEKAEKAAKKQRQRAEIAETELHVLRSGLRANGADPTQIQNLWAQIRLRNRQWREEKQRAEQAEAAIKRIRQIANRLRLDSPWGRATGADILTALDEQPGSTATQATEPDDTDMTEADIDHAMATGTPVTIVPPPRPAHDEGPSVRECADADRNWDVEKGGDR